MYDPVAYPDGDHLEPYDVWKARAENDIWDGIHLLMAKVPGYSRWVFAVPFGNYGQHTTNDPTIEPELRAFLNLRFSAWFTQPSNPDCNVIGSKVKERPRYTVLIKTTADMVYTWLKSHELKRAGAPTPL